jgi:outer membrane receptor protein involved in Fe transport
MQRLFEKRGLRAVLLGGAAAASLATGQVQAQEAEAEAEAVQTRDRVMVTGTRIVRQDFTADSPVVTVQGDALTANADITVDTFLNTLPQVNPAGTTTSNNPGNGGQANVDLRGFGANRNIVLLNGRRMMPSASNLTVDLNVIPAALIDRIEIATGGAGAVYGADAVAGAVNIILKDDFEGIDLRVNYQNSTEYWDAQQYSVSGVVGGNFDNDRGNAVLAIERSVREGMIKSQRPFAEQATATTSFFPEGSLLFGAANSPTEASVDAVFAGYGVNAANVSVGNRFGFNLDGTLFSAGVFNNPSDVENFRYDVDGNVNQNIFPDAYSYNFDFVNLLTLPLERDTFMGQSEYRFDNGVEVFGNVTYSQYSSAQALAPTPIPTVRIRPPGENSAIEAVSALVEPGRSIANQLIIPTTNPFIPADLAAILASRTGDDPNLVGAGATEPFQMRQRTLAAGLRQSNFENTVTNITFGASGPIGDSSWRWNAYVSEGDTEIDRSQQGNIDTNRLQILLEAADGGASICTGGFNPFGRQPLSQQCIDYLEVSSTASTEFSQTVVQGYVTGDAFELPAGPVSVVLGAEYRGFDFAFDPGSGGGPISGFNAQNPNSGTNSFEDIFTEALIPLTANQPWAQSLDLTLGYRFSQSEFTDGVTGNTGGSNDSAYKAELSWTPLDYARVRASYQHAVRAPNFGELFGGGGAAPQYFDPCSVTTQARTGADSAQVRALCAATGVAAPDLYAQTPGTQASITTSGNTNLNPESADTYTVGMVFSSPVQNQWMERFQGSLDYWYIDISSPILSPGVNQIIADCYNYYGNNSTYDASYASCLTIVRGGGDIFFLTDPTNAAGLFPGVNGGQQQASGLDLQINYGFDLDWLGAPSWAGSIQTQFLLTHLLEWNQQELSTLPVLDFAGTASFFGEGLGTSFPEWKALWNTRWSVSDFDFDLRGQYVSSMENRANIIFPGETSFTGTDSIWYWDAGATWNVTEGASVRLGVNNLFDEQPPEYAPNVQSGTDPSLFDVVGRRVFGQIVLRY